MVLTIALPGAVRAASVYDAQGTSGTCIGLPPVVNKCVQIMTQSGLIKDSDLGYSGITFKDDGAILKVDPGSASEQTGLHVGDVIVAVNGSQVRPTLGMIAAQQSFGARGQTVQITVLRAGAKVDVSLTRAAKEAPPGPKGSMFFYVHPIINWRGQFVPCVGAGPAGEAAIEYCASHFKGDGYIKTGDYGTTGLEIDQASATATITAIDPNSPAATAGLKVGDQIIAVNGQPLTASLGEATKEKLFGKNGDVFQLIVSSGEGEKQMSLKLGPAPKNAN
jgi:S1-C subfamily serine protease